MQTASFIYLILMILYFIVSITLTVGFIGWMIYDGWKNTKNDRCFFHNWNKKPFAIAGAYWYFQCPNCGKRDAIKLRPGDSPVNQRWLDGDVWHNPDHPPTERPETLVWTPFFSQQMKVLKYTDWPYTPPIPAEKPN